MIRYHTHRIRREHLDRTNHLSRYVDRPFKSRMPRRTFLRLICLIDCLSRSQEETRSPNRWTRYMWLSTITLVSLMIWIVTFAESVAKRIRCSTTSLSRTNTEKALSLDLTTIWVQRSFKCMISMPKSSSGQTIIYMSITDPTITLSSRPELKIRGITLNTQRN